MERVYWIRWELIRARSQARNVTIALAVSSIYAVDFSINVGKWDGSIWRASLTVV
jgi:hypothetical protein